MPKQIFQRPAPVRRENWGKPGKAGGKGYGTQPPKPQPAPKPSIPEKAGVKSGTPED